jgi:hypothetical protein
MMKNMKNTKLYSTIKIWNITLSTLRKLSGLMGIPMVEVLDSLIEEKYEKEFQKELQRNLDKEKN